MILFEEALKTVLSQPFRMEGERVAFSASLGRILAEDLFSDMEMPPFDKSAVDGYACRISDFTDLYGGLKHEVTLRVIETIAAGTIPQKTIQRGQCSKIMTGATVPGGADCVIMVENTVPAGDDTINLIVENRAKNICYRGEDIKTGDRVLQKGTQIAPAHIAVMAAVGAINPLVARLPRVGIIATGDELVEPGSAPGPGRIRNSNGWQLEAQVRTVPSKPFYYGIVPDEAPGLRRAIDNALENNDVVLLTGGVSMGDFDFVPSVMEEAGIGILFKKVAVQPGKPTVFGRRNNKYIFGMPGNPVSCFVIFEMLVKPFLRQIMGCYSEPVSLKLPMGNDFTRWRSERKALVPVIIKDGAVFPVEYHGSAHINAYTAANGIMDVGIGITTLKKGEEVHVRPL